MGAFLVAVNALAREIGDDDFEPFPPAVRQYTPLLVDLVSAKSAADVTAALEKYAEPVGGWKAKRQRGFGASLVALVGAAGGLEGGAKSNGEKLSTGGQLAVFTPIGLDVSYKSAGIVIAPIDVGALTAIRLADDDTLPELRLSNMFAPSAYVRISPFDSPFVFGVGGGIAPGLRSEDSGNIAWRALVYAAVDVMMFSF